MVVWMRMARRVLYGWALIPTCWICLGRIRRCSFVEVDVSLGVGLESSKYHVIPGASFSWPHDFGSVISALLYYHDCLSVAPWHISWWQRRVWYGHPIEDWVPQSLLLSSEHCPVVISGLVRQQHFISECSVSISRLRSLGRPLTHSATSWHTYYSPNWHLASFHKPTPSC